MFRDEVRLAAGESAAKPPALPSQAVMPMQEHVEVTMPKSLLAAALAALTLLCRAATAAELSTGAGAVRTVGYYWQGPYVGANLGYQRGWINNRGARPAGVVGGVQGGYNWQTGWFVFGAETDLQISDADDRFAPWKFSNPWFGTMRGRAGVAFNNVMLYGTLGLAYGLLEAQSTVTGASESKSGIGWTAGFGLEVALMGPWTAKAEYLYVDLDDRAYALTGTRQGIDSNVLRFGVNYRF
jgi:outer membrane immunogenic protein